MASFTTPLPSTCTSSNPSRSELMRLPPLRSFQRAIPRTLTTCRSALTVTDFRPSTTRLPLGSTCVTRAVNVVLNSDARLVSACPSSFWSPFMPAIDESGPATRVGPPIAEMPADALDFRLDAVVPREIALAWSATTIVTRSFTCAARRSRETSANRPEGSNREPGDDLGSCADASASAMILSNSDASGGFLPPGFAGPGICASSPSRTISRACFMT